MTSSPGCSRRVREILVRSPVPCYNSGMKEMSITLLRSAGKPGRQTAVLFVVENAECFLDRRFGEYSRACLRRVRQPSFCVEHAGDETNSFGAMSVSSTVLAVPVA